MLFRSDPWTLLGIGRNASEREIKSAYARLLRITRPDEDAEAFQRLVEARDAALAYARQSQAAFEDSPAPITQFDVTPPVYKPDSEWLERASAPEIGVAPEPIAPSDSIRSTASEIEFTPPVDRPVAESCEIETASEITAVPEPAATIATTEPEAAKFDVRIIIAGLSPNAAEGQLTDAARAINDLNEASIAVRRDAELLLLIAIDPLLPVISTQLLGGQISGSDWLKSMREDEGRLHRLSAQSDLVLALNEEFGWTNSDRRLHVLLGSEAGTKLIGHLRTMQQASVAKKESAERRWRSSNAPTINEIDARAYFNLGYDVYAPLLAKMQSDGRFSARRRNTPFLLPFWRWLDLYHILLMSLLPYLILFWAAVSVYLERNFFHSGWAWIAGIGVAQLVALPFCLPAFGKKSEIRYFLSKVAQADRQMRFDPAKRAEFLRANRMEGWHWIVIVSAWGSLLFVIEHLFLPFIRR